MNRLVKLILATLLWRNYKVLISSTLILVLILLLSNMVQSDYLATQLAEKQLDSAYMPPISLSTSQYLLWLVYVLGFLCWYAYNRRANCQVEPSNNQTLQTLLRSKAKRNQQSASEKQSTQRTDIDYFAHIRHKQKLRSEADILLQKKTK